MAAAGSVAGVEVSFDEVYVREYPRLVKVAHALTGRRSVAEEVAQECLLAAWRRWEKLVAADRVDLWLRRAAVNRCISLHRRAVAEAAALARVHAVPGGGGPDDKLPDPALWAAVRSLSGRQRTALVLAALEGRTAAEIGDVLGCSAETAQTHLRRGRARLAQVLGSPVDS